MNKKAVILLVLSIGMMAFMSGCTTFDNFKEAFFHDELHESENIRIGVLEPQSGSDKEFGRLEIEGIELAHEIKNKALGRDIELIYSDTQSSMYSVDSAVTDLINKKPAVVLGSYGDAITLEASSLLRPAKIPAIGITTLNPLITGGNDYYFKVAFSEQNQGRILADFIYDELKLDSVGIIKLKDEDITSEMVTQFSRTFEMRTGSEKSVAVNASIDTVEKNYTECVEKVKASGVKTIFIPTSLKVAEQIFKIADNMKLNNVLFIGPHGWHNQKLIDISNKYPDLNIAVVTDIVSENKTSGAGNITKNHEIFLEAYHDKFGDIEPPRETALAFDAYMLAVDSIEKAGTTESEALRKTLAETKDYSGVTGSITFNKKGEPHKRISVDYVKDGKFLSIYTSKNESEVKNKKVADESNKNNNQKTKQTKNKGEKNNGTEH